MEVQRVETSSERHFTLEVSTAFAASGCWEPSLKNYYFSTFHPIVNANCLWSLSLEEGKKQAFEKKMIFYS